MADSKVHVCACPHCRSGHDHPDRQLHLQINLRMSPLDEQQCLWFAVFWHSKEALLRLRFDQVEREPKA